MDSGSHAAPNALQALIARAQAGDQLACAALYEQHVQPTYRLAYGILLNAQDAEEVVQDSFIYAFRNLGQFDPARSAFKTWLYMITLSRCRNKRRRWLPVMLAGDAADHLSTGEDHPESVVEQHGVHDALFAALAQLSPKLREAVVLRYFDGLTYQAMAEVLGCPQKTAESRVRLAHEALYNLLASQREALLQGAFGR